MELSHQAKTKLTLYISLLHNTAYTNFSNCDEEMIFQQFGGHPLDTRRDGGREEELLAKRR